MKRVKFKKRQIFFSLKFITILSIIFAGILTNIITNNLSDKVISYSKTIIKNNNHEIFKNAYTKAEVSKESNDLIKVIKNSNDEILEVYFDMEKCNVLLSKIIENIDVDTNSYKNGGYVLYVPTGFLSDSIVYSNLGPKIPVVINVASSALGNVRTKITEYGINSALVEIYLDVELKVEINMPFNKGNENLSYSSLIASKIINGKVPTFYDGTIKSKSKTINVPIN